ncbi:MAG: DUF4914 family protein [bacterium]|nr:DUF4914 family protein [bacterium]
MKAPSVIERFSLPNELRELLENAPSLVIPTGRDHLIELSMGGKTDLYEVAYDTPNQGMVTEAEVVRCKNGVAVNYTDPYMRRRDPDCMVIADHDPSDKTRFEERFGRPFDRMRGEVLEWLSQQDLMLLPFKAGHDDLGYEALLVAPVNAAFFATALADLQGMIAPGDLPETFKPRAIIYLAPPFRHTHCEGRQVVVHNRGHEIHEVYSLNLYPGPSAKKGVYGILLSIGESEGWVTAHSSTVQVVTPYDNIITIMHEGASGSGKSEMLEHVHREADGRLLLGSNVVSGERRHLSMGQTCALHPVTDDMALCHPTLQHGQKLVVTDAENGWFLRINHIDKYGTDPDYESLTIHPKQPVLFLNIQAVPGATCLIWEHTEDSPGVPCPNPRVIISRSMIPNVVDEPVEVDVRSFGIRTPPCTKKSPSYGIFGLLHYIPPSLAWLWRMVAPRGHANPSITDSEGMSSEGVGSYWPFATGRRVDQANLLLEQILSTPDTRYTITPNQHVGAWKVGFMPQWLAREYMARRGGARFRPDQLKPARCPLLGWTLSSMQIEGTQISHWFLQVETQPEVGLKGYDAGAAKLAEFFRQELGPYLEEPDLHPTGRQIIECFMQGGKLSDYAALIPQA